MVVVRCDTLLCATHRVAAAPAALATGTGRPVALRDMRGRHTRSLGAAGLDWVVSKLDLDGASPLQPSCGRLGRACMGRPLQHMVGGVCNKVVLIRLGIT